METTSDSGAARDPDAGRGPDAAISVDAAVDTDEVDVPTHAEWVVTHDELVTSERGRSTLVRLSLTAAPGRDLVVVASSDRPDEAVVTPERMVITNDNCADEHTFTVRGVDDDEIDWSQFYSVTLQDESDPRSNVVVRNVENVDNEFLQVPITVSERIVLLSDDGQFIAATTAPSTTSIIDRVSGATSTYEGVVECATPDLGFMGLRSATAPFSYRVVNTQTDEASVFDESAIRERSCSLDDSGTRFSYVVQDERDVSTLVVQEVGGRELSRVTVNLRYNTNQSDAPRLSPDGRLLAHRTPHSEEDWGPLGILNIASGMVTIVEDSRPTYYGVWWSNPATLLLDSPRANGGVFEYTIGDTLERVYRTGFCGRVSRGGRYVSFLSDDNRLVPGDEEYRDLFVWDREHESLVRITETADGVGANDHSASNSYLTRMSANGHYLSLMTAATNLGPTNPENTQTTYVTGAF